MGWIIDFKQYLDPLILSVFRSLTSGVVGHPTVDDAAGHLGLAEVQLIWHGLESLGQRPTEALLQQQLPIHHNAAGQLDPLLTRQVPLE